MITLSDIQKKILQCSQNDNLEIIISLRAFLLDIPDCPYFLFTSENYSPLIQESQKYTLDFYRKKNEFNIRKITLKPIDIHLMPRNKKNSLIELIDGILKNNNIYDVLVYDGIRSNPYCEDELFEFIKLNMKNIDENIYKKYKLRNDDLRNIVSKTSFSNKIYFSTYDIAKKNKIKEYWKNLWGLPEKYFEEDVISNIILK